MPKTFPQLIVEPGDYLCKIHYQGTEVPGEIGLDAGKSPIVSLMGEFANSSAAVRSFPEITTIDRLKGRLKNGHGLLLTNTEVQTWFPGQTVIRARYALVGLGLAELKSERFKRIRFQVTGLDAFFGVNPLKQLKWPKEENWLQEGEFSATVNPEASFEYREEDIVVDCRYESTLGLDAYSFNLRFAPVISIDSSVPLTIDDWIEQWIMPTLRIVTVATRQPLEISWVTAHDPDETAKTGSTACQLFGSGMAQQPYEAARPEEWQDPERRPLFALSNLQMPLPSLVRKWRQIESEENPFLELFRLTLFQTDLPQRAKFLYLVQSLEALHGYQNRDADGRAQEQYSQERTDALKTLTGVDSKTLEWLRNSLPKRRPDDLARRLRELIECLPDKVQPILDHPKMSDLRVILAERGATTLPEQLRVLRNDLAHGSRNYATAELRPWVSCLELLCRAHLLRLLDFDPGSIEQALVTA